MCSRLILRGLMDLPNKDRVNVEPEKVRDYLLSEAHLDGYGKAEFFVAKGFRREAWYVLAEALRQVARENIVMKHMTSPHGQKYIVDGILRSPTGVTALVRTVWFGLSGSWTQVATRHVW